MKPRLAVDLPEPDADARWHGDRVAARIRSEIERQGGSISFARYMDLALHAPGLGYYSAGSTKLGAAGDFVTAPEISPLFGRCVARQIADVLRSNPDTDVLEFGAGSGEMAAQILTELDRAAARLRAYHILELSADLRARQHARLGPRVHWLDRLPESVTGVVIANEVLDAMPIHRLIWRQDGIQEQYVAWQDGRFVATVGPLSDGRLQGRVDRVIAELGDRGFHEGYVFEINLAMEDWLAAVSKTLRRGVVLVIDYGFSRRELYHPQRGDGTLMCHYRHRAHGDPLILTGLQDITAHVDFTALAEAAVTLGLEVAGFTTQANFLLANGLAEIAEIEMAEASTAARALLSQQIQRLTFPGEMGEKFKVIALTRDFAAPLRGFALRDERGRL